MSLKAETLLWVRAVVVLQLLKYVVASNTDGHSIIWSLARLLHLLQYSWSPPLHSISTPDQLCDYNYTRDCIDVFGQPGYCASGAIKNYTSQIMNPASTYNCTDSLLFLANLKGEIHQPLRARFAGDGGGAFIHVWWLKQSKRQFHGSVFSSERYYNQSNPTFNETLVDILGNMSLSIYTNLMGAKVAEWSPCPAGSPSCPDKQDLVLLPPLHCGRKLYAEESIGLAYQFAYANVTSRDIIPEQHLTSRLPIVELRQADVRLAATLNRVFDPSYSSSPPAVSSPGPLLHLVPSLWPLLPPPRLLIPRSLLLLHGM